MIAQGTHRSRVSRRSRGVAAVGALVAAVVLAAGCGGGGSAATTSPRPAKTGAATTTSPTPSRDLVATLQAPGHRPKVGNWPIAITLRWRGSPARGHVSYEFLLGGQVVSRQPVGGGQSPDFTGVFHDVIIWPASSVGYPLTFRAVVTSPHGTKLLDYPVVVRR